MKLRFALRPEGCVTWGVVASVVGKLMVGMTERGEVCRVSFLRGRKISDVAAQWKKEWPQVKFMRGAVAGWERAPVLLVGTDFQHSVWRAMSQIPAGRVTTYGDIAKHIGKAGAARAVGTACGANPVPVLVPCHRVVAAGGKLGGFSGGLEIKRDLLKSEARGLCLGRGHL